MKRQRKLDDQHGFDHARIVTPLRKLMAEISADHLLEFMHRLKLKFTLNTGDQGKYFCRVYKQVQDPEMIPERFSIAEYTSTGKSPQAALRNAIAEFLVCEDGDYHEFMRIDWKGNTSDSSGET